MQSVLKQKLWAYIAHNNPDLMISLQEKQSVDSYLEEKVNAIMPVAEQLLADGKPPYLVEELCMNALTEALKPSRYLYILSVIEEEFPQEHGQMKENGTLTYEVINLIEVCKNIFSEFDFKQENEDDRFLRYAVIGQVHDYLV